MQVLKFGGTSLGNAKRIHEVCEILVKRAKQNQIGIVLSAVSGVTNILDACIEQAKAGDAFQNKIEELKQLHIHIVNELALRYPQLLTQDLIAFIEEQLMHCASLLQGVQLIQECPPKIVCQILGLGEILSTHIVYAILQSVKIPVTYIDAKDFIKTKGPLHEGVPIMEEIAQRFAAIKNKPCVLMSGFIASDSHGNMSLLGRNGSDYSASLMAVGVEAECCEIWTDVDGIYTADPNQVPEAKLIQALSYGEAMELAFYGAKVLHPKTTAVLVAQKIPLYIKNSLDAQQPGTKISYDAQRDPDSLIRAVSNMKNITLFNIYGAGMKGALGLAARVFEAVAQCGVSIVLISQASSEYSICFCVLSKDADIVYRTLQENLFLELQAKIIENIEVLSHQAIICIVGDEMRSRCGIAGKFFNSLAHASVNIVAIAQGSSERCISAVIDDKDSIKAVSAVHQTFFHSTQIIELYIMGTGSVGSELIEQLRLQQPELLQKGVKLKVCAIANTRHFWHQDKGLDLAHWQKLDKKNSVPIDAILAQAQHDNPFNGILVDCTDSENISQNYINAFKAGLHVVAANKKANSANYAYYQAMRETADKYKRCFFYETNVGAGLPVIENFKSLMRSGDQLLTFSGILSGSLSFILGALEEGMVFSEAVRVALERKFTEPDPREDLSGKDIARKLLILTRELGLAYELKDIQIEPILPPDFDATGNIEVFLKNVSKVDSYFSQKMKALHHEGKVLRYIAQIKENTCNVKLCAVGVDDPLYPIKNGENAFAFLTKRYSPIPLVVRGYGAGVAVTASGLFADILKTIHIN